MEKRFNTYHASYYSLRVDHLLFDAHERALGHFQSIADYHVIFLSLSGGGKCVVNDSIFLVGFRGIREQDPEFVKKFLIDAAAASMDITRERCLLYAGHVGIGFAVSGPIYGFNPQCDEEKIAHTLSALKEGTVYEGKVTDDTAFFHAAKRRGVEVLCLEYKYEKQHYERIQAEFQAEFKLSRFRYSFYREDGDDDCCNCATWPGKIGLWPDADSLLIPEETGQMADFMKAMKKSGAVVWLGGN